MKKIFTMCTIALLAFGAAFAQVSKSSNGGLEALDSYVDTSTQYLTIEDKYAEFHPHAKSVQLTLEYTPYEGTVRVFYTCSAPSYDQGEAMNTVDAVLEDFQSEQGFHTKPIFVKKDRTSYFKLKDSNLRMATYRRWVQYTEKPFKAPKADN